jgi:hypothetical protein
MIGHFDRFFKKQADKMRVFEGSKTLEKKRCSGHESALHLCAE